MKLFRITSSTLPELYVFAHDRSDAEEIYRSFKMLLDWTQDAFQIEHVDRQPGWKQNRTLKRLLKAETRGVAKPHPRGREWLTETSRWMIWPPPDPDSPRQIQHTFLRPLSRIECSARKPHLKRD